MLVLSFFIAVLLFLILGICFGKLKVSVKKLSFEMIEKEKYKNDFNINIGIYLFGIIKFFGINFEEDGMRFLFKKISYEKIKNSNIYKTILKKDIVDTNKKLLKNSIKDLNIKLEKINLNLRFGTDSTLITSFCTFAVSTILSFIIQKGVTKYNSKKHKFIITPVYDNSMNINVFLELAVSLNLSNIIKFMYGLNNLSKVEHNKHKVKLKEIEI